MLLNPLGIFMRMVTSFVFLLPLMPHRLTSGLHGIELSGEGRSFFGHVMRKRDATVTFWVDGDPHCTKPGLASVDDMWRTARTEWVVNRARWVMDVLFQIMVGLQCHVMEYNAVVALLRARHHIDKAKWSPVGLSYQYMGWDRAVSPFCFAFSTKKGAKVKATVPSYYKTLRMGIVPQSFQGNTEEELVFRYSGQLAEKQKLRK